MDAGLLAIGERKENKDKLLKIIALMKYRVESMTDFVHSGQYFFQDPNSYEEKGLKKYLKNPKVWDWIPNLMTQLNRSTSFKEKELERIIRQFAEKIGVTAAKLIHPLRLALCGISASPGLFEVMEILGKETVIRRLNRFIERKYYLQKGMSN
jgi:glutamyl/glutaminyl-tRNA synthetase